jgi:hypothetical protein
VHVILLFPLPSHEIAPGKKKNDQRRRLRRDQCFTIHKQPSMLPDQREEIVLETASSPLPRRLLPKRVVHVPFWFFPFYFSLFRRSLFLAAVSGRGWDMVVSTMSGFRCVGPSP